MSTIGISVPLEGRDFGGTLLTKLSCALLGHHVDNRIFAEDRGRARHCRCGAFFLTEDGAETRIRHNVRCFVAGHHYVPFGERHDHREYVCLDCGHPLLFESASDPYAGCGRFKKKVRYFCNLFGHRVHRVALQQGQTEYACGCGHSFMRPQRDARVVKHPLSCLFAGHFVSFVERRGDYTEYLRRSCGHTFCFEG